MTPERAKELLPIIQAYAEGKTIQYRELVTVSIEPYVLSHQKWSEWQDVEFGKEEE